MKKTLFAVVAAAAMVIGFASCDLISGTTKDAEKNDPGAWKGQSTSLKEDASLNGGAVVELIDDTLTFNTTEWKGVWTDTNGVCLEIQPTFANGKYTFSREALVTQSKYSANPNDEAFVLYINVTGKDELVGKDVRGRVNVYKNKTTKIKASKYAKDLPQVGIVTIECDEPKPNSMYAGGNYEITEIWPLDPREENDKEGNAIDNAKVGGQYVVEGTMKFEKLQVASNGGKISIPVKAGNQIIALKQPNRNDPLDKATPVVFNGPTADMIKNDIYADGKTRAEILELNLKDNASDEDVVKAYQKGNLRLFFGADIVVNAHKENTTSYKSSAFGKYWFVQKLSGEINRYKSIEDIDEGSLWVVPEYEK